MEELISSLKKKDDEAFKKVMDMYKNKIFKYLRFLVNDSEMAEELTQDTFVKVYFKAHTLKTNNLKSWIYTIATNLARSEFRKKKAKKFFSVSDMDINNIAYNDTFEGEVLVERMISTLPEKYRIPLIMKLIDNFSFEEISNVMKKPTGTVKTLVFRAKNQLRSNFLEQSGGIK